MQASLTSTHRVALTVAAAFFMVLLDSTILNTSLPRMAQDLGLAPLDLSVVVTVYLLAAAAVMPASAWLAQRFGAKRCFMASLALFTLASVGCGLAQSLSQLVAARLVQGLGGGVLLPVGRILIMRQADKSELMQATALVTWPALLAPVIGPALGGWITTDLHWRWNFLLNLPIGLLTCLVCLRVLPLTQRTHPDPLDLRGAAMAALCSVLLLSGLELAARTSPQPRTWLLPLALLAAAATLIWLTRRHLMRTQHPILSLAPLQVRTFEIATVSAGLPFTLCLHATPFLLPLMFQVGMGLSAIQAGLLVLVYFVGNLSIKAITTPLLRRFGFRQVMVVGSLCAALSIAACATLSLHSPTAWTWALLYLAGATRSVQMTAMNTLMFADIDGPQRNAAATLASVFQQLSSALAVALGALTLTVTQLLDGREQLQLADFRWAFLAMAALALLGTWRFGQLQPQDGAEVSGHRAPTAP